MAIAVGLTVEDTLACSDSPGVLLWSFFVKQTKRFLNVDPVYRTMLYSSSLKYISISVLREICIELIGEK